MSCKVLFSFSKLWLLRWQLLLKVSAFCRAVTSSVHSEHYGKYQENAVLRLCLKKLGHLGLISSEALLQRRMVSIHKYTKTLNHSSTEDHTHLKPSIYN